MWLLCDKTGIYIYNFFFYPRHEAQAEVWRMFATYYKDEKQQKAYVKTIKISVFTLEKTLGDN